MSGAAGSAVIVAAKHGLKCQAVGGVGADDMGDWVQMKLAKFGIDTELMQRCDGFSTSSSLVTGGSDAGGERGLLPSPGWHGISHAIVPDCSQVHLWLRRLL